MKWKCPTVVTAGGHKSSWNPWAWSPGGDQGHRVTGGDLGTTRPEHSDVWCKETRGQKLQGPNMFLSQMLCAIRRIAEQPVLFGRGKKISSLNPQFHYSPSRETEGKRKHGLYLCSLTMQHFSVSKHFLNTLIPVVHINCVTSGIRVWMVQWFKIKLLKKNCIDRGKHHFLQSAIVHFA